MIRYQILKAKIGYDYDNRKDILSKQTYYIWNNSDFRCSREDGIISFSDGQFYFIDGHQLRIVDMVDRYFYCLSPRDDLI